MGLSGQKGSACIGRGGDLSSLATTIGNASIRSEASELMIDRDRLENFEGRRKGRLDIIKEIRERHLKDCVQLASRLLLKNISKLRRSVFIRRV